RKAPYAGIENPPDVTCTGVVATGQSATEESSTLHPRQRRATFTVPLTRRIIPLHQLRPPELTCTAIRAAALEETLAIPVPPAIAIPSFNRECVKIPSPVRYSPTGNLCTGGWVSGPRCACGLVRPGSHRT